MNPLAITSKKPTSKSIDQYDYYCSIDKCTYSLYEKQISLKDLEKALSKTKLVYSPASFVDRRRTLTVSFGAGKDFHFLYGGSGNTVHTLITNPSNFQSYTEYYKALSSVFSQDFIMQLPINRIDLTIDVAMYFEDIIHLVDVKYKRTSSHAAYDGSRTNAINYGKTVSGEYIKVYAKRFENLPNVEFSRIEVQLKPAKLNKICKRIHQDIFSNLTKHHFHKNRVNPFKNITLVDFELVKGETEKSKQRYWRMVGALEVCPRSIVRRRLNSQGNFKRDFKGTIKEITPDAQLWVVYMLGIQQWFEKGTEYAE